MVRKSVSVGLRIALLTATCVLASCVERRASAPPAEPPVVASSPWGDVSAAEARLSAIREAEKETDAMRRCQSYPALTGVDWPAALTDALCADFLTSRIASKTLAQWIDSGEAHRVDEFYDELQDGYAAGRVVEGEFWLNYERKFWVKTDATMPRLEAWLRQRPGSAHAHTALAWRLAAEAWDWRGNKFLSDTSKTDLEKMRQARGRAAEHARAAIRIRSESLPAYVVLIKLLQLGLPQEEGELAYRAALALRPDSYYLRSEALSPAQPQWGGSLDEMDAIAEDGLAHVDTNPRMPLLRARALAYRGMQPYWAEDYVAAAEHFEAAAKFGPPTDYPGVVAYTHYRLGDHIRAAEVRSQQLRFDPGNGGVRFERAKHLSHLGLVEWAESEFRTLAAAFPDNFDVLRSYAKLLMDAQRYQEAETLLLKLLSAMPGDRVGHRSLASIYLYRFRVFEMARKHIDIMLAADPKDGAALLLQLDYLQNTLASQARQVKAGKAFVDAADVGDPEQAQALPKVRAWLQSDAPSSGVKEVQRATFGSR